MDFIFDNIYKKWNVVFQDSTIDLSSITFFDPWSMGIIALKAIENKNSDNKDIKFPIDGDKKKYLARMHFGDFIKKLAYEDAAQKLEQVKVNERENKNIQEIFHCEHRDQFNARLESGIRRMFQNFGMNIDDEQRATALVGELGNNVFDHNAGIWPLDVSGAIIIAQNYPEAKRIEVIVADPGVGFIGSLKTATPRPDNDIDAIKLGLRGISGRIGEKRGNGLLMIQDWTIKQFNGIIRIQSGTGLIEVNKGGIKEFIVNKILGTIAGLVVYYK